MCMETHTCIRVKQASLVVRRNEETVFSHNGSWLHPLFDLEKYLRETRIDPELLVLQDKIIGKAAAFLVVNMGFKKVKALTLSVPGKKVFEENSVDYEYETLVDKILCRTEQMLAETSNPLEARKIIDELMKNSRQY